MRGFVFTISVILITMLILSLSSFESERGREISRESTLQQGIGNSGYAFDDVSDDLKELTGASIGAERNETYFWVTAEDGFPFPSSNLSSYENYMEEVYAKNTHSNISIDASGMNDSIVWFTNGINYTREEGELNSSILLSPKEMNATDVIVSIVCNEPSVGIAQMESDEGGELHVLINYSDSNTSFLQDIYVNKGTDKFMEANFSTNALRFGINQTGEDYDRVYVAGNGNPSCSYELKEVFRDDYKGDIAFYYNTIVEYTQLNVTKNGYVEIGRV